MADYLLHCIALSRDDQESWDDIFSEDDDSYHVDEWYVVAMAAHLTPCPGLDLCWQVLQRLLGLVGVDPKWVERLTSGWTLDSLVDVHGDERLWQPIGRYLGPNVGGWLPPKLGLHRLETSALQLPSWVPSDEVAAFETAVETARSMLASAQDRVLRMVIS
ncbi:MAG: hypothetical protein WKF94_14410 [Solirubrobacteraceae bacterium]